MSVTDLTLTKWCLNSTISTTGLSADYTYQVNFYLYQGTGTVNWYKGIKNTNSKLYYIRDNTASVIGNNPSNNYRYIYIFNGVDATNSELISWLTVNAVQQENDLTEEYITNLYDLTIVANAVRGAIGEYNLLSYPDGMANILSANAPLFNCIQICERSLGTSLIVGASRVMQYAFAACNTLTNVELSNCTSIAEGGFYNCQYLTTVTLPNCTYIGNSAFMSNYRLSTITAPKVTEIRASAFRGCSSLTSVSLPMCTVTALQAFSNCRELSSVYMPALVSIGDYTFANTGLTYAEFSACTSIGMYAFTGCSSLTSTSFATLTTINNNSFDRCINLIDVYMPSVTVINGYAFRSCYTLPKVSFPLASIISGGYVFQHCSALSEVILPSLANISGGNTFSGCFHLISLNLTGVSSVPLMSNSNTFYSTPIAGYTTSAGQYGSIYVPASLYTAFTSATNWAYFSARMVSV